jgi:phospholipid/cholesterol/gamma-HCH transport system ATP-binding protein
MAFIELRNIHKSFGRQRVLSGVSLDIEKGEGLVIIGASGSGKSVLLKHIVGLLKPDKGEVWFDGGRVDNLRERELMEVRTHFGFLFQMGALFDSLTVAENVAFPLVEHTDKPPEEIEKLVRRDLGLVGLNEMGQKMPAELSGGQRKRAALARAIALNPDVVLYDEPTTGLDPIRADVINELILKLQRELNITHIVVTHDMASAFKVGKRIVMLHEANLIFDGSPEEIHKSEDPRVKRFVLGEATEEELATLRR